MSDEFLNDLPLDDSREDGAEQPEMADLPTEDDEATAAESPGAPEFVDDESEDDSGRLEESDEAAENPQVAETTQDTGGGDEALEGDLTASTESEAREPEEAAEAPDAASQPAEVPEMVAAAKPEEPAEAPPRVRPPAATTADPKEGREENPQVAVPEPEEAPLRVLGADEQLDQETARKWDELLAEISQQTRLRVWETNISSLQDLLASPRQDLLQPRGPFAEETLKELEDWLASRLGFRLAESRRAQARAYTPPPVEVGAAQIGSRTMTRELAMQRRARLDAIRGDSRKRRT